MDPFNIVINYQNEQVDLNIHPEAGDKYKIVFHGGLVGEMYWTDDGWQAVSANELYGGGYPIDVYDETSGHADLLLDEGVVVRIGQQLDRFLGRDFS